MAVSYADENDENEINGAAEIILEPEVLLQQELEEEKKRNE